MKNNFLKNVCLLTDSYKATHWKQYPPKSQIVFSYLAARQGARFKETTFFGLQYLMMQYLEGSVVNMQDVTEANDFFIAHFGRQLFNYDGWRNLCHKHGGRLPVVIRAVPEGTVVPVGKGNVLMTIQNTDPEFFWLTNYLETLLVQTWYPSTVATQSREMKRILLRYLDRSGDPTTIDYKMHDFGFRGVSCPEEAAIGGAAHLLSFKGTDNVPGVLMHREFYGNAMAGTSVPASEHSTITSWGEEHECEAMSNMLNAYPDGIVACVSDSYDIFRAVQSYWGKALKNQILERDGVLVVRPDSGNAEELLPRLMDSLGGTFGMTFNEKGYKVLHPKVRLIQGDGVDIKSLEKMLFSVVERFGWSADNISFGSGGGLLRKVNRDTQRFAIKGSWAMVDGAGRNVYKNPVTDPHKESMRGRLKLLRIKESTEELITTVYEEYPEGPGRKNMLVEVFRDGKITRKWNLEDIRERAKI